MAVLLAAALRLARLDLVQFQSDEATWLRIAEDFARSGHVPFSGPLSSQGIPAAPHFEYFLAATVAVSREPMVATAALALANVASVAGAVWLGGRAFGPIAGIVAGLLFAAEPSAVFYARKIWSPDVIAPMAVLLLVSLEKGVIAGRARWAAASIPIVVLGTLIHFAFGVLAPLLLAPVLSLARARRWRPLGLGIGVALLITVPYLVHHVQTGWEDVKNFRYYASSGPPSLDLQALGYALSLSTGWGGVAVADVLPPSDALPGGVTRAVAALETALLGVSVGVALARVLRGGRFIWRPERIRLVGLLLWIGLPVLATTRHTLALQPHYYLVLYPVPYLLIGAACQWLFHAGRHWGRGLLGLALAAVSLTVAVQVLAVARLLAFVATGYEPCYGAPLRLTEATAQEAVAFGAAAGTTHAVIENEDGDADAIAYLARPHFPRLDLAGVGPIGLGERQPGADPAVRIVLDASRPLDLSYPLGVQVAAASVSDDPLQGGRVRLAIGWQVDGAAASNRPLVWEVRLSDASGRVVHRASGVDHVPSSLRGERMLSWFTLDTPREIGPGPHQIGVRLLDAYGPAPLAFVDAKGQSSQEWTAGPIAIASTPRCRPEAP